MKIDDLFQNIVSKIFYKIDVSFRPDIKKPVKYFY